MLNAALVLEGGSLRSLYTAGFLDVFLENNIEFSCIIAVSAGSLTAANYISKQKLRSAKINILHSNKSKYYGVKQFITKRNAFNFDYLFNEPINHIYPYDENTLLGSKQRFIITATDCKTGNPIYFENKNNYKDLTHALKASSSIPFLADVVNINGFECLDGGITDPIGLYKAQKEKFDKIVVVLTREKGFRKKIKSNFLTRYAKLKYKNYPNLINKISKMSEIYNLVKEDVEKLEDENKIYVIQPKHSVNVSRMEKNARKLVELYFDGRDDANDSLAKMLEYLQII